MSLTIRTLDVFSALLSYLTMIERAGGYGCCSSATTGLRIFMMWRSSMSRAAGWPVDGFPKGWTESLGCMRLIAQFVPDEWGVLDPADAAWRV